MDSDIEHTYEALEGNPYQDFEEFLGMASVAFRHVCRGNSAVAKDGLNSLSTWELGQVAANADRMRTLAQELLAKRGKR